MDITETGDSFEDAVVVQDAPAQSAAVAKLDDFSNMGDMLLYAETLLKSKLMPTSLKTPEAVVSVILMGKELGFGPMTSLTQLNNIQGRVTMSIHAIGAKIRQAGCDWETLKDFQVVMGPEMDKQTPPQPTGREVAVDMETVIRFYKPYRDRLLQEDVRFTWRDAEKMGLTTKENWVKMKKVMLWSRCFSIGARRTAPDALLGVYENAEWADVSNKPYKVDSEGEVTIL